MKRFFILLLLALFLFGTYFLVAVLQKIKPDMSLLRQSFSGAAVESALSSRLFTQEELISIQKKYEDSEEYITKLNIPDFSPEQDRPKIHAMAAAMYYTLDLLEKNEYEKFSFSSAVNVEALINAYFNSRDPNLLLFAFQAINSQSQLDLAMVLAFTRVYSALQASLGYVSPELSIKVFSKIKEFVESNAKPDEPIAVLKYLLITQALPFKSSYQNLLEQAKPHLLGAISVKDGKGSFTPEQSAEFSLGLIDFTWQCSLLNTEVPTWLLELTEKEACRLAYRLEQDGCLPTWERSAQRVNLNEFIYHAYLLFKREDLLFISCNGVPTSGAYPPDQLDFNFEEIGLYVSRTSWERNPYHHLIMKNKMDEFQMTYDISRNLISLSLGPVTQLIFAIEDTVESLEGLKAIFREEPRIDNTTCYCNKPAWEYTVLVQENKLKLQDVSKIYLLNDDGTLRSEDRYGSGTYNEQGRQAYKIEIEKDSQGFVKKIFFKGGTK